MSIERSGMLAADIWMIILLLAVIAGVLYLTGRGREKLEAWVERVMRRFVRDDRDRDPAPGDTPE